MTLLLKKQQVYVNEYQQIIIMFIKLINQIACNETFNLNYIIYFNWNNKNKNNNNKHF